MPRIPRLIALSILLAGCSSAASEAEPTPGAFPSREPVPSAPSASTGVPNLDSADVTFADAAGDLTDLNDQPVAGLEYIDITSLQIRVTPLVLEANLSVVGFAPSLNADTDAINYLVVLDTDGDDEFEFWLGMENRSDTLFYPSLDDWVVNYHYDEEEYPGTGSIAAGLISWQVPMSALGNPNTVRVWVWTEKLFGFDVVAHDFLPASSEWLTVR
jgi:hypothetical protein